MQTLADRLRIAMQDAKINQKQLADAVGVKPPSVNGWLSEKSKFLRGENLLKAAQVLGVSDAWLATGKGSRLPGDKDGEPGWLPIEATVQGVALGAGVVPDEYAETHKLMFRSSSLARKGLKQNALRVHYGRGESMLPTIKDGAAMLIDTSDSSIKDGKIYWVRHEGLHFVKRLHKLGGTVLIESDNKADPESRKPVLVKPEDDFEVIGRVRWIASWED